MRGIGNGRGAPRKRSRLVLYRVALCTLVVAGLWSGAAAAADSTRQFVYRVKHSLFGDIGTYTNLVQTVGDTTTVRTTVHFAVTALGIGLHREDDERTERWSGDGTRLVFFHGVTKKNGDVIEIQGQASGNNFVIQSPLGTITAPGSVRPANPWSLKCLESTSMMRVDTGKVEQVQVSGGGATTVDIDGVAIPAREYQIDGAQRYRLWFDQQGTPIMFVVDDDSGKVTFTLRR